jgi:hypothetical protein
MFFDLKYKSYLLALVEPKEHAILIARGGVSLSTVKSSPVVSNILGCGAFRGHIVVYRFLNCRIVIRIHTKPIVFLGSSYNTRWIPVA